jgi:hypothetical protein
MCEILPIDHLNFDNTVWTFRLDKIVYQLKRGAFSTEMLQEFLYSKNKDLTNPYTLFGTGSIDNTSIAPLTSDTYCILLKRIENKKQAFIVHTSDFQNEFFPHQSIY